MNRLRSSIEQRFASRRARRRLFIVWSAVLVATAVLPFAIRLQDALGPAIVVDGIGLRLVAEAFPGFLVALVLGWMLRTSIGRVSDLPDEHLDERQLALRDRTYVLAYRGLAVTVVWLLLAAWIVADASATRVVSSSVAGWIMSDAMFVMIALALFLPSAVMAWHADDDVAEPEEVAEAA